MYFFHFITLLKGSNGTKMRHTWISLIFPHLPTGFPVLWGQFSSESPAFLTDKFFWALGMRRGRKGKRVKVQKVNFGEEVILTWDWNLKTDVKEKEQKQPSGVTRWMGRQRGIFKVLCFLHYVKKNKWRARVILKLFVVKSTYCVCLEPWCCSCGLLFCNI